MENSSDMKAQYQWANLLSVKRFGALAFIQLQSSSGQILFLCFVRNIHGSLIEKLEFRN